MKKWAGLIILLAMILTGCTRIEQQTAGAPRVVTGIEASFEGDTMTLHRSYSNSDKLRGVLTYLRCLEIYGIPDPDVTIPHSNRGRIIISFSDGSTKTYEQLNDQFLRQDDGPWHYINQEQAQEFSLLLKLMESDEIS